MAAAKKLGKVVLSGIQPTGIPHLGNYLGALREWSAISKQKDDDSRNFFSLMDLHAITIPRKPEDLRRDVFDGACTLLACGIEPKPGKNSLFIQSNVKQHLELYWSLQCLCKIPQLQRMTQFKDKSANREDADVGLLVYPVLMAADILVYRATHVPVGEDQVQHLELTRDICTVFNRMYCKNGPPALVRPTTVLRADTKKIMSLCEPSKKMSKSEPKAASRILMSDTPDEIKSKISKATTDSLGAIDSNNLDQRLGVCNLIAIIAACESRSEVDVRKECHGMNMVQLKARVTDAVANTVDPVRRELERLRSDRGYVLSVLSKGKDEASEAAEATMVKVREAIGFLHCN